MMMMMMMLLMMMMMSAPKHLVHMRPCSMSTFVFDYVYFNLFKPFVFMDENFHPVCASLVGEAFAPSASLQLPFFSQEPYASLLATAGLPQACWRKNLKKKRSHLPHWNCPFSKKLLSFDMKCRDSRHEKGMMRRKIKRLIKRR